MEEKIKENIAYLEYKFAYFNTISNTGVNISFIILDIVFQEKLLLGPDFIRLISSLTSYLILFYAPSNLFNFKTIGKMGVWGYLFLVFIANILVAKHIYSAIYEVFVFIPAFLLFYNFNKAILYASFIVFIWPISLIIYYFFGQHIAINENLIILRTILIYLVIFIMVSQIIYFLMLISIQKAILNYIQTDEITYDKYFLFNPKLHSKFGIKDMHSLSKSNSLEKLFEIIEMYMKQTKPWLDPDYSIDNLARDLKSNTLYISQAVNLYAKTNFKSYLNDFRLYAFIAELENNKDKKLSFKEVYLDMGFNNHATFNRVFKAKFEMTPQEYMKKNLQN